MALSFVQWEKYIQGFPDDRLGQEFQNPGSTVPGMAPPPQNLIVTEMGNRNAARQADEAMRASQGQSSGTIAEQTYNEFAGEDRPVGGPGGGPPPGGPGGPPGGGPPMGPGGPPMGPGGPPMGPGGPPPGGPPMGGPPMMADGGFVPGYQEGGFWSGLGRMATGASSWEDAAENPFRTLGHSALAGSMFIPGLGLIGAGGRAGLGLLKGARAAKGLRGLGRGVIGLEQKGGLRGMLGRALGAKSPTEKLKFTDRPAWLRQPGKSGQAGGNALERAQLKLDLGRAAQPPGWTPKLGDVRYPGGTGAPGPPKGWVGHRPEIILSDSAKAARRAMAAKRLAGMSSQVGRKALLRGGGALGIAGLFALDPFDEGDPDVKTPEKGIPLPNKDFTKGNAIREDTRGLYPWETEITPAARALQEMTGGQGGGDIFGDIYGGEGDMLSSDLDTYGSLFDDQLSGEWADFGGRASGGIIGLRNGGGFPEPGEHQSLEDQDPSWRSGDVNPDPERFKIVYDSPDIPDEGTFRERGETIWPGLFQGLGRFAKGAYGMAAPSLPSWMPGDTGGHRKYLEDWLGSALLDPSIASSDDLAEQLENIKSRGRTGRLVSLDPDEVTEEDILNIASEGVPEAPGAPGGGAPGRGAPESTLGSETDALAKYRLASLRDRMKWGQTETPQEQAVADWYRQQAETTRGRGLTELLRGASGAIAGAADPGGIARGLNEATGAQFALADRAAELERVPLTAAASRSRYNTFDEQQNVLGDIFQAITSRGDIDVQLEGQLKAVYAKLMEDRRITPQGLGELNEILEDQVLQKKMTNDEKNTLIDRMSRQLISSLGGRA